MVIENNINSSDVLKRWQRVLEGPLHDYLLDKYPSYMGTYDRFRRSSGPQCSFCKGAARTIFKMEAVDRKEFLLAFKENNWNGYF